MDFIKIIEKKRDGLELSDEEIKFFINGYAIKENLPDYQVSAFLMAILLNGLNNRELSTLTDEMSLTGDMLDFSNKKGVFVDKHSTGGVGDKMSFILAPIFAAAGLKVAKMSGRGLGFTGGTVDKIESIPGYKVEISEDDFINQVDKIGLALIGQSKNMVYADKKIYALRDTTGTVESIPLIASSIMSKKLAAGAHVILLDIKYGDGAFMKTKEKALELAETMKSIGEKLGRVVRCEITSMQDVLGNSIGNALEVREAIECLKGNFPKDVYELTKSSSKTMFMASGISKTQEEAVSLFEEVISNGKALEKFRELIIAQHGDAKVIDDYSLLNISDNTAQVISDKSGYLNKLEVEGLAMVSTYLGGGRLELGDKIDHGVGIIVNKKVGDKVEKGDALCTLYMKPNEDKDKFIAQTRPLFIIGDQRNNQEPLVYKTI
jgi:pyrimidine-nucleoside phosphorylase